MVITIPFFISCRSTSAEGTNILKILQLGLSQKKILDKRLQPQARNSCAEGKKSDSLWCFGPRSGPKHHKKVLCVPSAGGMHLAKGLLGRSQLH
jgi:hypothetical protein